MERVDTDSSSTITLTKEDASGTVNGGQEIYDECLRRALSLGKNICALDRTGQCGLTGYCLSLEEGVEVIIDCEADDCDKQGLQAAADCANELLAATPIT